MLKKKNPKKKKKKVMSWKVILAISEIKLLNVKKTGKILRTLINLNKKMLLQFFCRIPYAGVQREKLIKNLVKKLKKTH